MLCFTAYTPYRAIFMPIMGCAAFCRGFIGEMGRAVIKAGKQKGVKQPKTFSFENIYFQMKIKKRAF